MSNQFPMTDEVAIQQVLALLEVRPGDWSMIHRNGRVLLALPPGRRSALRTLKLYQPQRLRARATMAALDFGVALGIHRWMLPRVRHTGGIMRLEPDLPRAVSHSTGILLGSQEHKVRRAIACYQTESGVEVAKIAFGHEGLEVIQGEASALQSLPVGSPGVPPLLGFHRGTGISMMRLPLIQGNVLSACDSTEAVMLLNSWRSGQPARPADTFPEWRAIAAALSSHAGGKKLIPILSTYQLEPAIRHGDFARWNLLRQNSGNLMVLDWEWGVACGMPGLDLVHFFAQDARLVGRLAPDEVTRATTSALSNAPCACYLKATGWRGDPRHAMLASIAFTVGTGQQANEEVLSSLINALSRGAA